MTVFLEQISDESKRDVSTIGIFMSYIRLAINAFLEIFPPVKIHIPGSESLNHKISHQSISFSMLIMVSSESSKNISTTFQSEMSSFISDLLSTVTKRSAMIDFFRCFKNSFLCIFAEAM